MSSNANDFYSRWFRRTMPPPLTEQQLWERHTRQLRSYATSEVAEKCAERFDIPEVEEAEAAFKQALAEITDPELRNRFDTAAGKISRAYQILGFCAGHFSQDPRALNF